MSSEPLLPLTTEMSPNSPLVDLNPLLSYPPYSSAWGLSWDIYQELNILIWEANLEDPELREAAELMLSSDLPPFIHFALEAALAWVHAKAMEAWTLYSVAFQETYRFQVNTCSAYQEATLIKVFREKIARELEELYDSITGVSRVPSEYKDPSRSVPTRSPIVPFLMWLEKDVANLFTTADMEALDTYQMYLIEVARRDNHWKVVAQTLNEQAEKASPYIGGIEVFRNALNAIRKQMHL
ncbi:hypothetical protein BT69DRAFT_1345188 [Atractiella rhizophila]|nr:hypothetical protein BT69DRAFT_1345188 [Atractiella rhizophila]